MQRPPSPPSNGSRFFDSFNGSSVSNSRRKPRGGRLFPPIAPSPLARSMPSILVNEEIASQGTPSQSDSDLGSISHSLSPSPSLPISRSSTPISDGRRVSNMMLTGKAPPTPATPATPIFSIKRQHSYTKEKVIVGVRLRPFITEDNRLVDANSKHTVVSMKANGLTSTVQVQSKTGGSLIFDFDHGFSSFNDDGTEKNGSDQIEVYVKMAQPLVESMIGGFNCSFFAYGQTGTGKTYSTLGAIDNPGIVPRFCRELLERLEIDNGQGTWTLEISYLEIYNENIIDLLNSKSARKKVRVREHPEDGPFVENLLSKSVTTYGDIEQWLNAGNVARHKASTARNDGSSRSHAVFSLKLIQMTNVNGRPFVRKSKANFVDLAGSERLDASSTSMSNADRMAETKNINKSLTHLATVILQLASGKRTHISYRDSVLTWLLKDSLGGNAKTVMLATVAPSMAYSEETLSTLRYAANAYKIYNKTYVNEDPAIGLIEQLRMENEALKAAISSNGNTPNAAESDNRVASLKAANAQLTAELAREKERSEEKDAELALEKAKYASIQRESRTVGTDPCDGQRRYLTATMLEQPILILLSPDMVLSESNAFVISIIGSRIGRSPDCSISLANGTSILDVHCVINRRLNRLFVIPRPDAVIYINGRQLQTEPGSRTELFNGDRMVLGVEGEFFFKAIIPSGRQDVVNEESLTCDYWKARTEFLQTKYEQSIQERARCILMERQNTQALLEEMTETCKAIFEGVRFLRDVNDDDTPD